ncbi:MAG: GtrA family protein [Kiritimatiellia bacterium]
MAHLLNPEVIRRLQFLHYRYRFLALYVLIGFLSIILEILCFRAMEHSGVPVPLAIFPGLACGILFAFWANVRFNFKIPAAKRNRALLYFVLISAGSAAVNYLLKSQLESIGWKFAEARLVVAGSFFLVAYLLHRRFSFADYKRVGVAIYANGIEDIGGIHRKIGLFPDFIHVDIIDETFGLQNHDTRAYRLEVIRAYWPTKEIHVHVMSKRPLHWIDETAPFAHTIFIHLEIEEDLAQLIQHIRQLRCKAGICLTMQTPVESLIPYLGMIDAVMVLAIPTPGRSGQKFDLEALDRIRQLNAARQRGHFSLCVDGGINEQNIGLLNVEDVVSGSSVLDSPNPIIQVMRLQTSSNYETT